MATPATRERVRAMVVAAVVLGVLDAGWLGLVSGSLYRDRIGHLLAADFVLVPAVCFYLVYVVGLTHFVILPGLVRAAERSSRLDGRALADAALFGVVTYATFDLTSMAVMRDFPLSIALVDIAWGAVLCVLTTTATLLVLRRRR